MRIIPAIDIIDGKCVRLTQGQYDQKKIYNEHPLEVAKQYEDHGIRYLHLVDLDGAKAGTIKNYPIIEKIATQTRLKIDFGGGLKTNEDLKIAFESGARQITGGSIAVKNRDLFVKWLHDYGSDKIILGADVLNGKIATHAWQKTSDHEVISFITEYVARGIAYSICTDVSKDGMLKGPSKQLYRDILDINKINLIASGGISSIQDLKEIKAIGCEGAIIGKAIYENKISLQELEKINEEFNA